jgi:hypothetical protein
MLQGILQGAGPGNSFYKVLTGLFVIGSPFLGVLFLAPRSRILCLLVARRFVPGSSFLVLLVLGVLGALGALGALDRILLSRLNKIP